MKPSRSHSQDYIRFFHASGGILLTSMMIANFLNFAFNAFLGRMLSFESYGLVTTVNAIWSMLAIFLGALGTTVNQQTSYLNGQKETQKAKQFMLSTRHKAMKFAVYVTIFFVILSPFIAQLFRAGEDILAVTLLGGVISAGVYNQITRAYLQGTLRFTFVSLLILAEAISKVLIAIIFVIVGLSHYAYLAIPLSILCVTILMIKIENKIERSSSTDHTLPPFSKVFFFSSMMTICATTAFLQIDMLLAKHYLPPTEAGKYAVLALVGKMIYFFGSLFNALTITFVSKALGEGKNSEKALIYVLTFTILACLGGITLLGYFAAYTVPFLFGAKALTIIPYATNYTIALSCYTIANVLISYHLARKHYIFPIASLTSILVLFATILAAHETVESVANAVLTACIYHLTLITLLHLASRKGKFVLANLIDLTDLFRPNTNQSIDHTQLRVTIFNWRDLQHVHAGGAEVYVHELATRLVKQGMSVILFCGNDGHQPRNETIDGVRVIRRGGFFTVYIWAALYYLVQLRSQTDIVIESQNGAPFFTPLYSTKPIIPVIHHINQELFQNFLSKPAAIVAKFIEKHIMPFIYRQTHYVVVSPSTQNELQKLTHRPIISTIIHNGVNLTEYIPGPKSAVPTVLYVGRLKGHKQVNILLHAAREIRKAMPAFKLIIAGDGDERDKLIQLTSELGLNANVTFTGKVSESDKIKLYQQAWVCVQPSMVEGWGITTIEANACATPVIASDIPGLRDAVKHNISGYLVPPKDIPTLATTILALLQNQELRETLNSTARTWSENFSWDASASKLINLIKEVINDNTTDKNPLNKTQVEQWKGNLIYEK